MKVLNFKPKAEYYNKRAEKNAARFDFFEAVIAARRAVKLEDTGENRLNLAYLYMEMGCAELAANELYKILAREEFKYECYYALSLIMKSLDDYDACLYYLNSIQKELDISPVEYNLDTEEDINDRYRVVYSKQNKTGSGYREAKLKCDAGDYESAYGYFESIPADSDYYIGSLNNMAVIDAMNKKYGRALKITQKVLDVEEDNFAALCTRILIYYKKSDTAGIEKIKNIFLNDDSLSVENLYKLMLLFDEMKDYENALIFADRLSKFRTHDILTIRYKAFILHQLGRVEEARGLFKKIGLISDYRFGMDYFCRNEARVDVSKLKHSIICLPHEEIEKRIRQCVDFLKLPDKKAKELFLKDDELKRIVYSVISLQVDGCYGPLINKLYGFNQREAFEFLSGMLIDTFVPVEAKKMIIRIFIFNRHKEKTFVMTYQKLKHFTPLYFKIYENLNGYSKLIYALAFAEIAVYDMNFERKLKIAAGAVLPKLKGLTKKFSSGKTVAAIILILSGAFTENEITERLGIKKELLIKYRGLLEV